MEKLRGASIAVATGRPDLALGAHELRYELQLRDVCKVPTRTASWAVLQQRGVSVKSSLKHTVRARNSAEFAAILRNSARNSPQFSARAILCRAQFLLTPPLSRATQARFSSLDNATAPTRGTALRLVTELALPPLGDCRFAKHAADATAHVPLLPGGKLDLKLSSHFGLLLPLGSPPEGAAAATSGPSR